MAMLNYQRVNHPLDPIQPPFSHGFPMVFPFNHHLDPGKQLVVLKVNRASEQNNFRPGFKASFRIIFPVVGWRCLGLPPVHFFRRGNCPRTKPSSDFLVPAIRWLGNSIRSSVADSQFNRQLGELGNRNTPWHAPFIAPSIHHWIGHVQNHQPLVIHQPIPTNTNHSSTKTI